MVSDRSEPRPPPGASAAPRSRAEALAASHLDELETQAARRVPDWGRRGPEDPARLLLEAFALALGEVEGSLDDRLEGLTERVLAELGEEPRWPEPARSAIRFEVEPGLAQALRIPAGTGVTERRTPGASSSTRGLRAQFETAAAAWASAASLRRALVIEGGRVRELPLGEKIAVAGSTGLAAGPAGAVAGSAAAELATAEGAGTPLFSSTEVPRHLYLGDEAWESLRWGPDEIWLEWAGAPRSWLGASWEYSVRGGWRSLPVELEEARDARGEPVVRQRIHGPLPDLVTTRVGAARFPWFRLALQGETPRFTAPRIAWCPEPPELRAGSAPERAGMRGRRVARLLSGSPEAVEDHSFEREELRLPLRDEVPTLYLAWDRPLPASLFFEFARRREGVGAQEAPQLVWEHWTPEGFREFTPVDGTRSFTRSGTLSWALLEDWTAGPASLAGAGAEEERSEDAAELFWMRARWTAGAYVESPWLRSLIPHAVEVIEGRRRRDVELLLPSAPELRWHPLDLDESEGRIAPFDDLELEESRGRRALRRRTDDGPLAAEEFRLRRSIEGRLEIELPAARDRELRLHIPELRHGLSEGGLGPERLDVLELELEGLNSIARAASWRAGRRGESPAELAARCRAEWGTGRRAVTAADYCALARALDPGLERVEVLASPDRPAEVSLVVISAPHRPGAVSLARREQLARELEVRAPLGTRVRVVEPAWLTVDLELAVTLTARDDLARELLRLEAELRDWFCPLGGGREGRGLPLGLEPSGERLARDVETWLLARPGIASVGSLALRLVGSKAPATGTPARGTPTTGASSVGEPGAAGAEDDAGAPAPFVSEVLPLLGELRVTESSPAATEPGAEETASEGEVG